MIRRLAFAILLPAAASCAHQAAPPPRDLAAETRALLQGLGPGRGCSSDADCAVGPSRGACSLGACFGLLTADQRPLRRVQLQRVAEADAALMPLLRGEIVKLLGRDDAPAGSLLAGLEGAGAIWRRTGCQDEALREPLAKMRGSADAILAATARLQLGRCGDAAALPELLEDAHTGSELLRTECAQALRGYANRPERAEAVDALLGLVADRAPPVQRAAVLALLDFGPPDARTVAAVQDRAPTLGYLLERGRTQEEP